MCEELTGTVFPKDMSLLDALAAYFGSDGLLCACPFEQLEAIADTVYTRYTSLPSLPRISTLLEHITGKTRSSHSIVGACSHTQHTMTLWKGGKNYPTASLLETFLQRTTKDAFNVCPDSDAAVCFMLSRHIRTGAYISSYNYAISTSS